MSLPYDSLIYNHFFIFISFNITYWITLLSRESFLWKIQPCSSMSKGKRYLLFTPSSYRNSSEAYGITQTCCCSLAIPPVTAAQDSNIRVGHELNPMAKGIGRKGRTIIDIAAGEMSLIKCPLAHVYLAFTCFLE